VLRDISFQAKAGESVAIVGATGSGKSTLLNLLTRLYEPQEGQILIDGVDITQASRTDLRRKIGVVPQDVFLFQGNILDNIRLGHPDISDAEAIRAADNLHLDEIVARFPGGYFEPIAERGKNLSSGEKQLIAFARMLVVAPRILALDEATSNVDSHTEQLLQEAVQRLMVGRTSIIIAHRLSTIRDVDRILVLHEGALVESGNHNDLLAARGVYWHLDQMQHQDAEA
jgi:ATP-binding cassette subfamily B multidrug efflux pump